MKKSIVTIVAFMLLALAGFAQGGERVYIQKLGSVQKTRKIAIYEKAVMREVEITNGAWKNDHIQEMKEFADILEKYFNQGFKLINAPEAGLYILQKD